MGPRLYRSYSCYLRERYGGVTRRVCVDPGFGCPNSERGGCIYCSTGAIPPAQPEPVEAQIRRRLLALSGRCETLLLYFQSGSGTHAEPAVLKDLYDRALGMAEFRELIVATRPDCVDRARADLLGSYVSTQREVWVELGLQSAHDRTLRQINRGHPAAAFIRALDLLRGRGVRVAVHLIHGLPGEGREDFLRTVRWVAARRPDGIKIHNLHVVRGTPLAGRFLRGEITVPAEATHLRAVAEALELLPPQTVIMRVLADTPPSLLLAPRHYHDKSHFLRALDRLMAQLGSRQGGARPILDPA